jgi:ParB family chromosome partitioning protein
MRKALGRGLDALIPTQPAAVAIAELATKQEPLKVPLSKVRPNHLQPRRHFDPETLRELTDSIKKHGLAQPLVVSADTDGTYELIAGERRLRACELAGFTEVEVVVRQPTEDKQRLALALVENLQREDLNAVESALGYLRLQKEFDLTQNEVADEVGKSKQSISNTIHILDLPEEMQKSILTGQLKEAHGRALLKCQDAVERHRIFTAAIEGNLSVRDIDDLVRKANVRPAPEDSKPEKPVAEKDADTREMEGALQQRLGTKVAIRTAKGGKGTLTIHFYSFEDFERVVGIINK